VSCSPSSQEKPNAAFITLSYQGRHSFTWISFPSTVNNLGRNPTELVITRLGRVIQGGVLRECGNSSSCG
jgi:hypothetical protein